MHAHLPPLALFHSLDMPFPPTHSAWPGLVASSSVNIFTIITQLFPQIFLCVPKPFACPLDLPSVLTIGIYLLVLL